MKKIFKLITPKVLLRFYHFILAYLGAFLYGFPSRKMIIIGVFGTRGKTTTANFIWSCLTAAGYKAGLTGTANIRIGDKERLNPYHMTMPGRFKMQKLLSEMYKAGCNFAVLETPSEGVEQSRHRGIAYDMAVFTTLYPEYLAVHNWSYERCKKMHVKVFETLKKQPVKFMGGKRVQKIMVMNNDIDEREMFLRHPADLKVTYGISHEAQVMAKNILSGKDGVSFFVGPAKYELKMPGEFNVINALAAIATISSLGLGVEAIQKGLSYLQNVPGRMEKIDEGQNFSVFVDYAHDSVSLEAALMAMQNIKQNSLSRVIVLTGGQGGGRDKKKLPIMGNVAAKFADFVVIANEDPYDDDPREIMEVIAKSSEENGKTRGENLFVIDDRREGIRKALSLAKDNDIVLISGKGAEQSMMVHCGKSIPWDDRVVVREEIRKQI